MGDGVVEVEKPQRHKLDDRERLLPEVCFARDSRRRLRHPNFNTIRDGTFRSSCDHSE